MHTKDGRFRIKDAEIKAIHQENFKQEEKPKKAFRRSAKQKQSKQVESVPKMSAPTDNTSNELKKHTAKLTEAKKRLKERNAINFKKKKKINLKRKRTHKHAAGKRNKEKKRKEPINKKETKKDVGKSKKSIKNK